MGAVQLCQNVISQDELRKSGLVVAGVILCNKCRKKMNGVCLCGNDKSLIEVYSHGRHYQYRRDDQGQVFRYQKALERLIQINMAIKDGKFNPVTFTYAKVKERLFETQIQKWLI